MVEGAEGHRATTAFSLDGLISPSFSRVLTTHCALLLIYTAITTRCGGTLYQLPAATVPSSQSRRGLQSPGACHSLANALGSLESIPRSIRSIIFDDCLDDNVRLVRVLKLLVPGPVCTLPSDSVAIGYRVRQRRFQHSRYTSFAPLQKTSVRVAWLWHRENLHVKP
jgi:hypothetical protein